MKKLLALLLTLMLCGMAALCPALAEDDGAETAEDDDAMIEWLYEEDMEDEELLAEEDLAQDGLDVQDDEQVVSAIDDTEQDDLVGAMEVYSWFVMEPLDVDESLSDPTGTMWRVLDERFNTKEAMLDILHFYFSDEIVDELWNGSANPYKEIDGYLYTDGEGRGMDERIGETEIEVVEQTDAKITLNVSVHYTSPDEYGTVEEAFTYERELIGDQWKYTLFPFFW